MNFKERGITVGDLLIIIIIIISTSILFKTLNKNKKTSLDLSNQEKISLSNNDLKANLRIINTNLN